VAVVPRGRVDEIIDAAEGKLAQEAIQRAEIGL